MAPALRFESGFFFCFHCFNCFFNFCFSCHYSCFGFCDIRFSRFGFFF